MSFNPQMLLYLNDSGMELFFEDTTGSYTPANPGGYGAPNPTSSSFTTASIVISILGTTVTYDFVMMGGFIMVATVTLAGGTPINILPNLTANTWPLDYSNPFNLTPSYWSATLPDLEDYVYPVEFTMNSSTGSYTLNDSYMVSCAASCCISKQLLSVNINDKAALVDSLIPTAFLAVAGYAQEDGLIDKANTYLSKAAAICEKQSGCGCGC